MMTSRLTWSLAVLVLGLTAAPGARGSSEEVPIEGQPDDVEEVCYWDLRAVPGACVRPSQQDPSCMAETYLVCPVFPFGVSSIAQCPNAATMVEFGPGAGDEIQPDGCYCAWGFWGELELDCPDPTPELPKPEPEPSPDPEPRDPEPEPDWPWERPIRR